MSKLLGEMFEAGDIETVTPDKTFVFKANDDNKVLYENDTREVLLVLEFVKRANGLRTYVVRDATNWVVSYLDVAIGDTLTVEFLAPVIYDLCREYAGLFFDRDWSLITRD